MLNDLKNHQGIYILVIHLPNKIKIHSKHSSWRLREGYYLYFGSAKGKTSTSLGHRLSRHLNEKKKKYWHIDYLLTHHTVKIVNIYYTSVSEMTECSLLRYFRKICPGEVILGFGSSDCKSQCGGHLLFFSDDQRDFFELPSFLSSRRQISLKKVEIID